MILSHDSVLNESALDGVFLSGAFSSTPLPYRIEFGQGGMSMKRRRIRVWALPSMQRMKALLLTSCCSGLGIVLGCFFSLWTHDSGAEALNRYLETYLTLDRGDGRLMELINQAWSVFRLPLLVILLRFTVLGVLIIPILMGMKGFLLSFAISSFVKCYGLRGELAALLLFGILSAVEMVILLFLAMESWVLARERGRGGERNVRKEKSLKGCVICIVILCADIGIQSMMTGWMGKMLRWMLRI